MQTECTPMQIKFQGLGQREIVGKFDGGQITSDGGAFLLRETERRTGILNNFTNCFTDFRDEDIVEHKLNELLAQRVYGLALGYEDLNDHDDLRHDQALAALCEKQDPTGSNRKLDRDKGKPLAGKSTLNRIELTGPDAGPKTRYKKVLAHSDKIDDLFVDTFLQAHKKAPEEIILDADATDDPLHGDQEGRFFHGYYKSYCYLPLYIFCGQHLLCARLRTAGVDASNGTVEELTRIVARIRNDWPDVRIIFRGDSGFCRKEIMQWCDVNDVEYIIGLAQNSRLNKMIHEDLVDAEIMYRTTGKAFRIYDDFYYKTEKTWSRYRRVVSKAEFLTKGKNPRYVVTTLPDSEAAPQVLYEKMYCARGEMENRIKEQQLYLFADRTSTSEIRSNQIRLYFSSIAYVLMSALRRLGLKDTSMARAQCHTIREKLFKIAAKLVTSQKIRAKVL